MFTFGRNWQDYSKSITRETLDTAALSIMSLLNGEIEKIAGKTVLDIGCGSGLFSNAAYKLGAIKVVGIDVDELCVETSREVAEKFGYADKISFSRNSILDSDWVKKTGRFDFVYAWGSLHHTGNMWKAIENACALTDLNGVLVLAIYNRHWSSGCWKWIKKIYNLLPSLFKPVMTAFYVLVLALFRFPYILRLKKGDNRGMTLLTDAKDWLGGWPYEFADAEEILQFVGGRGFRNRQVIACSGWTGCNQFVFERIS